MYSSRMNLSNEDALFPFGSRISYVSMGETSSLVAAASRRTASTIVHPPRRAWKRHVAGLQLHSAADVEGLRHLREETVVRAQPEPLDGGHEAPLQPEPAARPPAPPGQGDPRVRLHALPQSGQSSESRLGEIDPRWGSLSLRESDR